MYMKLLQEYHDVNLHQVPKFLHEQEIETVQIETFGAFTILNDLLNFIFLKLLQKHDIVFS